MGHKGLHKELTKDTFRVLDLLRLAGSLSNPGLGVRPAFVQSQETTLASPLNLQQIKS
jgi:hypothetical protein